MTRELVKDSAAPDEGHVSLEVDALIDGGVQICITCADGEQVAVVFDDVATIDSIIHDLEAAKQYMLQVAIPEAQS